MDEMAELVATTRDGRVRYTREQRERVLDLFEKSGMSGKAFARSMASSIQPLRCGADNGGSHLTSSRVDLSSPSLPLKVLPPANSPWCLRVARKCGPPAMVVSI